MLCSRFRSILGCFLVLLLFSACLNAATVSGTLKDSTGAVIVGGKIEIYGSNLPRPIMVSSDSIGHFTIPDLKAGSYSLRATSAGFEALERVVERSLALGQPPLGRQRRDVGINAGHVNPP